MQALGQAREVLGRSASGPLLLYDARCSVCRRFVTFVVHADRSGTIRIAPLVGSHGDALRRTHPVFGARESAVWIPRNGPAVAQSDAILAVLRHLGGGWKLVAALGAAVPAAFRNAAYRWFAQHRRWFSWLGLADLDTMVRSRLLEDSVTESWYDYRR